ncbi:hypothetical protein GSI_08455 [Ganoderma sinense ZZ0214-1]|uniref:Uncharacterized protein n=1 Tax=Ganoderma sinense ZZ0214-1 TaxID=1077348 RepID=A0A2G8S3T4_9APHY|nr:hypothetical protein GSI_08455 [Ganoderma sinense ZZ0214-1]
MAESSDPDPDSPSPWIGSYNVKEEISPREREVFARAQNEMESKADSGSANWTTRDLVVLIRASRSTRLASRPTKKFAKHKLAALWAWDLASVSVSVSGTPDSKPVPFSFWDIVDTLLTARYGRLPQIEKRALYELVRRPDFFDVYDRDARADPPTEFFLSDRQLFRLFLAREELRRLWREFVSVRPGVLRGRCPAAVTSRTPAAADQCSAARRRCARKWGEEVGEEMLSEEHRYDPIRALDVLRERDWAGDGMCGGCVERLREACAVEKAELWEMVGKWLGDAEYDEDLDAVEVTPWDSMWPEWDSEDEEPVVEDKKRKVGGDGDVKVEEGEDPLLVKALAENAKRRKKIKAEAVCENTLQSDGAESGIKVKHEEVASGNGSESGEGQSGSAKERSKAAREASEEGRPEEMRWLAPPTPSYINA